MKQTACERNSEHRYKSNSHDFFKNYTNLIQALKNVELENTLLKTELVLHQAEEHGKAVETSNSRLAAEVQQLRVTSSRAIKQFEKRTSDGI